MSLWDENLPNCSAVVESYRQEETMHQLSSMNLKSVLSIDILYVHTNVSMHMGTNNVALANVTCVTIWRLVIV